MTRRLAALALALYPRRWRRRYGQELADLCDEYLGAGETTRLRLLAGLAGSGVAQRLRAVVASRRNAVVFACAVLVTTTGAVAASTDGLGLMPAGGKALAARSVVAAPAKSVAMLGTSCGCHHIATFTLEMPATFALEAPAPGHGVRLVTYHSQPASLPPLPPPDCPSSGTSLCVCPVR